MKIFITGISGFVGSYLSEHLLNLDKNNIIGGTIFSENDINSFKIQAEELNLNKEGDQACFLLRKMTC